MAYKTMKRLIALGRKTEEELLDMCDVYYGAGRITTAEYNELVALIKGE
jgi:hypothetical protein